MPSDRHLPHAGEFISDTDEKIDGREIIFPLCIVDLGNPRSGLQPIGTCFMITAKNNLFMTARHVIELAERRVRMDKEGCFTDGRPVRLCGLWFYAPGKNALRPVIRYWKHPVADIAVGRFTAMVERQSGKEHLDKMPVWDVTPIKPGEFVSTFAYPAFSGLATLDHIRIIHEESRFRFGRVTKVYPTCRDSVMLPAPCAETELDLRNGMSGGPVFNERGRLCGVNCSGFEVLDRHAVISYISLLNPILDLEIPDDPTNTRLTIREIACRRFIRVHGLH